MSAEEYYERLRGVFSASPPSGGAKKGNATGGKSASSKVKKTASAKKAVVKKTTKPKATAKKAAGNSSKKVEAAKTPTRTAKRTASASAKAEVRPESRKPKAAPLQESKAPRNVTIPKEKLAEEKRVSVQRVMIERTLNRRLENMKQHVEATKYYTPTHVQPEEPEIRDLPDRYGDCRIVCMVRDPYWIHTYWEITDERLKEAEEYFGDEWGQTRTVLRVHDVTKVDLVDGNSNGHFDIELSGNAMSWYVNVNSPNTAFVVDIVRISPSGKEFILARSNVVMTPRDGMSDILDEEWMSLDFDKMYALSGGFRIGASSMEMHEMMRERLRSDISSWGGSEYVSSFGGSPVAKERGFWFVLDCELIVYGATEPDAKVTMQGRPLKLRPDGTFTVRFALPDGVQKIDTTAVSADGVEERTITPTVSRNTRSSEKILKEF